jgi:uncharacterized protein YdeI (YjbR/CyaY-like superfamily)
MIYLLITAAGVLLLFAGLYAMSLGFSTPPNIVMFLLGLFSFVLGMMLIILFAGKVELGSLKKNSPVAAGSSEIRQTRTKRIKEPSKTIKSETNHKVVKTTKSAQITPKRTSKTAISPSKVVERKTPQHDSIKSDKSKPSRKPRKFLRFKKDNTKSSESPSKEKTPVESKKVVPRPMKKAQSSANNSSKTSNLPASKNGKTTQSESKMEPKKAIKPVKSPPKKPVMKSVPTKPSKSSKGDNKFVTDRLTKLKREYIENVDDVEELIEERLDTFRGAINQIRSESKEPSIIWSFDASDVQEAMKDTILKANKKVIMMYPWIRNIDVGILKKFMDTNSRMIIQEAGLDDDASVELIKVLLDNNVQIKTMPHIHTVAVVSDDKNGLIISTDPIYESFEVGVIYKDEKSILEIEKLFEEAWSLSKDITLENVS